MRTGFANARSDAMALGLIGRKVGMTRIFTEKGEQVPVKVIKVGPCPVVGKRTPETDEYSAVRLGFGERKEKHTNKPLAGEYKKANVKPAKVIREFRVTPEEAAKFEVGVSVKADLFRKGQIVDVVGTSRGKGFQGVVKRYKMAGFVEGHGTHEYFRHPGSIGQRKTPGKVWKNKRMPGHMGDRRVTTLNLTVVDVDVENDLLLVEGSVPGHPQSLVLVRPAVRPGRKGRVRKPPTTSKKGAK